MHRSRTTRRWLAVAALAPSLASTAHADTDIAQWIGPSPGSWFDATRWSDGVIPWNDPPLNFLAIIAATPRGGSVVTLGGGTPVIDALQVDADSELHVGAGAGLVLEGAAIDNDGWIGLNATLLESTPIRFEAEECLLYGSGVLEGANLGATLRAAVPTGRLVQAKGHRIHGAMTLGADSMTLLNEAEIVASDGGKIEMDLTDGPGLNANTGRFAAESSGALVLHDFELDNAGGVIEAMPGAKVRLDWVALHGGTLRDVDGDGPGSVRITGDTSLEGVTVEGPISIGDYGLLRLREGTQIGDLHQEGVAGISTTVRVEAPSLAIPPGAAWTNAAGTANTITGGGASNTLVVERGAAIVNSPKLGADALALDNRGVIESSGVTPAGLDLADGPGVNFNSGTMRAVDGATLELYGFEIDNTGGVIEAGPQSRVLFGRSSLPSWSRPIRVAGGVLRAVAGREPGELRVLETLRLAAGAVVDGPIHVGLPDREFESVISVLWIEADAAVPALVLMEGNSYSSPASALVREGPIAEFKQCTIVGAPPNQGYTAHLSGLYGQRSIAVLEESASFIGRLSFYFTDGLVNRGSITSGPSDRLQFGGPGQVVENQTQGVIEMAPASFTTQIYWDMGLRNHGRFDMGSNRMIRLGDAGLRQCGGAATIDGALTFTNAAPEVEVLAGVLAGTGSIKKRTENAGGTVAPGSDGGIGLVGTLSITAGEFVQSAGGTLEVDLGAAADADAGANPGDLLEVTGAAELNGTLRVRLIEGFAPSPGETFVILTASSIAGEFATIESIGHCEPFQVFYAATTVSVVFSGGTLADLDGDGVVDGSDLGTLLGAWGACTASCCPADLDGDGVVDGDDLGALLGAWS